jgi:hypothetical protein
MEEEHNKVQLVGIGGIALTYVLAVIFNWEELGVSAGSPITL